MKKTLLYLFSIIIAILIFAYLNILFILPYFVNSKEFILKVENRVSSILKLDINFQDIKLSVSPQLDINFYIGNLSVKKNSNELLLFKENRINVNLFQISQGIITSNYVYIDMFKIQELSSKEKTKRTINFDYSKIPDFLIKEILISYNGKPKVSINAQNVLIDNCEDGKKRVYFKSKVNTDLFNEPISVGENGYLLLEKDSILANKFDMHIGKESIEIDGILKSSNIKRNYTATGKNLNASEVAKTVLFLQKLKSPQKKFIENFKDFSGTINFYLHFDADTLNGNISAQDLSAHSVLFNAPIYFKNPTFQIINNTMTSDATGTLCNEKARHKLLITDILSKKREVTGEVYAHLTHSVVKKYMPQKYDLKNFADIKVVYFLKNKKPHVTYQLNLPQGSDLFYKNAYLGMRDKERQFSMITDKDGNEIRLTNYEYTILEGNNVQNILFGDGLWRKENGKMKLKWITCKTNGYAPVSVVGYFGRYIDEGNFSGDFKYDIEKEIVTGYFEVTDTIFNDFYVESAKVTADEKIFNIKANGKYLKSSFECEVTAKNDFKDKITVKKMNLTLDKFKFALQNKTKTSTHNKFDKAKTEKKIEKISSKVRDINVDINNWEITAKKLLIRNALFNNVKVVGKLENSIFEFSIPEIYFADGTFGGNGMYSFIDNSSKINLKANNIKSNIVATSLFGLKDYVQGIANASLEAKTYNNLESIKAFANFEIKKGFLPKLATKEFKRKDDSTFKISDYTNVDLTRSDIFSSNIKGQFKLHDTKLDDIQLTTQHKAFASYIYANYDVDTYIGNLKLYGKFDKVAPKNVRIMHIPLTWMIYIALLKTEDLQNYKEQIKYIPSIETPQDRQMYFYMSLDGNFKDNDINILMRKLK